MNDNNVFEKLEQIYTLQEVSEKLGMALTDEQQTMMAQLEEEVIKEKVLPVLAEGIEPNKTVEILHARGLTPRVKNCGEKTPNRRLGFLHRSICQ